MNLSAFKAFEPASPGILSCFNHYECDPDKIHSSAEGIRLQAVQRR